MGHETDDLLCTDFVRWVSYLLVKITKNKVKQSPLQAWTSPKASKRLRLPDFKTIGT